MAAHGLLYLAAGVLAPPSTNRLTYLATLPMKVNSYNSALFEILLIVEHFLLIFADIRRPKSIIFHLLIKESSKNTKQMSCPYRACFATDWLSKALPLTVSLLPFQGAAQYEKSAFYSVSISSIERPVISAMSLME